MRNKTWFFKFAIVGICIFFTAVLGGTFTAYLIGMSRKEHHGFVEVPGFSMLSENQPMKLSFSLIKEDAFLKENSLQQIWVIKQSDTKATVFSPICPHLGCRYNWNTDMKKFFCPCHASVFSLSGQVISGPSPRSLDTLPHMIKDSKLFVKWEMFKPGLHEKIEIYE